MFGEVDPGRVIIGEPVNYPTRSNASWALQKQTLDLNLKPGQTVQVTLGGSGRPVVGRVLLPKGIDPKADWATCRTLCGLALQRPEVPYPSGLAESEREAWYEEWKRSPEGKAFRLAQIRCGKFLLGPKGSLRVEDVPPGAYRLRILVSGPPMQVPEHFSLRVHTHNPIGAVVRDFVVPEMSGGRSDVPLDLGTLQLLPSNVNARQYFDERTQTGRTTQERSSRQTTAASSDPKARGEAITTPAGPPHTGSNPAVPRSTAPSLTGAVPKTSDNPLGLSDGLRNKLAYTGDLFVSASLALLSGGQDKLLEHLAHWSVDDPFSSQPPKIIPGSKPLRVYSVGPDGKDDGGKPIDLSDPYLRGDIVATFGARRVPEYSAEPELGIYLRANPPEAWKNVDGEGEPRLKQDFPDLVWGKSFHGLRAALELSPDQRSYPRDHGRIGVRIWIQNVSNRTIRFSSSSFRPDDWPTVKSESGGRVKSSPPGIVNTWPIAPTQYNVKPGAGVALDSIGFQLGPRGSSLQLWPLVTCEPGLYSLTYRLRIPDRAYPKRGEWRGWLTTGARQIRVDPPPQTNVDRASTPR
jgi:hypothetical protein